MYKIIVISAFVYSCAVFTQSGPIFPDIFNLSTYEDATYATAKNLLRGFSTTCLGWNQVIEESDGEQLNYSRINMLMYEKDQFRTYDFPDGPRLIRDSHNFDSRKPLIIFSHGWLMDPDDPLVKLVAQNYLQNMECNFLSFNTTSYLKNEYLMAVRSTPKMAIVLFEFLSYMYSRGVPSQNIHLIGFSLGAHISAIAARMFKAAHNSIISRITALDPASPCFLTSNISITQNDANYVDVIHTSVLSATDKMIGHANYYVNGKMGFQPGCSAFDFQCNHGRSIEVYAASIPYPTKFIAKKCKESKSLHLICQRNRVSYLGYGSDPKTRGVYLMNTLSAYPFTMGENGI